jgi:SH3-like domain-containing protein
MGGNAPLQKLWTLWRQALKRGMVTILVCAHFPLKLWTVFKNWPWPLTKDMLMMGICAHLAFSSPSASAPQNSSYRYAALKASIVNWRKGPGHDHPIVWIYRCPGWPVLIKRSWEHWHLVVDCDGSQGWVHSPLLSFYHTIVAVDDMVSVHGKPSSQSAIIGCLKKGAIGKCCQKEGQWYLISIKEPKLRGWVMKKHIWPH